MMIIYKLNLDGTYANKVIDGAPTQEWHNVETSAVYLAWLAEGNEPEPAAQPE